MNSKELIENVFNNYNFTSYPEVYKRTLIDLMDAAREELKDNLLSITLGGSGGKNKIIEGWSDLDVYIILKKYDCKQIKNLQKKLCQSNIHIGLTFYNLYEIENDLIDFKTKIMIYEKNNYGVNPTLYGNDYFKNVDYNVVYENDLMNYPQALQNFKRMYIEVLNGSKKIDKTYMKKMLVLIKCILSSYKIFAYGYNEVHQEFYKILYGNDQKFHFEEILTDLENNEDYILRVSEKIIEYTENTELFKKERGFQKTMKSRVNV